MATSNLPAVQNAEVRHRASVAEMVKITATPIYTEINATVPQLKLYFDGRQNLKVDFRLNRDSMEALMRMLPQDEAHGWGHLITTLITVYWLAHVLSYSVVSRAFQVPVSSFSRLVHTGTIKIAALRQQVIQFPDAQDLDEVVLGDMIEAPEVVDDVGLPPPCPVRGVCSGNVWRDNLAAKLSAPQVHPVELNEHDYL
ncbi:hypothetical protein E1301_Tti019933 [Triplophysa tibetana]|uniref:Uncharacterized protein n=1 Tax=Triplophysa tibetana TaxID=1572043 RepID=A0A5A9PPD7_9TELE|nr:hypothetical protein E1301_Tti019933 [Triplophysa tibetana]